MNLTDKTEDIEQLEELLATEVIEHFINSFVDQLEVINNYRILKPWESKEQ